jgi:hypothetical protein
MQSLIHAMRDAWREQARALLQTLLVLVHDHLSKGIPVNHVFAQVFAKQQSMVPP